MGDFRLGVSSAGRRVLEADLGDEGVEAWILRAREHTPNGGQPHPANTG